MQRHIFVVDDNDANLTMAAAVLEKKYVVFTIPSAEKMFVLLKRIKPDVILLDIEMPDMGGFDAIAKLKGTPDLNDIPVVFFTGWTDEKLSADAAKAGAVDILIKPVTPEALLECVQKIFDQ